MRIVFMGTGDIGVPVLRWLLESGTHEIAGIVTQPDRPAGRKMAMKASPIKELARAFGRETLQPERLRAAGAMEELAALAPEAIVVMAYGQILPRAILDLPTMACLNLHASLLPRHRGAAPVQAAIEAGDAESGITVIYMAEGLDTGDILLQRGFALAPDETGGTLHARLAAAAPQALEEALEWLQVGRAPRIAQEEQHATYAGKLTREHGWLDWSRPAEELERKVRALNPWPAALTALGTHQLKIFAARTADSFSGPPGVVAAVDTVSLTVMTGGGGALRIFEVQVEGKKRMSAGDFLRGHPVRPGARFA